MLNEHPHSAVGMDYDGARQWFNADTTTDMQRMWVFTYMCTTGDDDNPYDRYIGTAPFMSEEFGNVVFNALYGHMPDNYKLMGVKYRALHPHILYSRLTLDGFNLQGVELL